MAIEKEFFKIINSGGVGTALSNGIGWAPNAARLSSAGKARVDSAELFFAAQLPDGSARRVTA